MGRWHTWRRGPFCKWDVSFMERMFWRKQSEDGAALAVPCGSLSSWFNCGKEENWTCSVPLWPSHLGLERDTFQSIPTGGAAAVALETPLTHFSCINSYGLKKVYFWISFSSGLIMLLLIRVLPAWTCLCATEKKKNLEGNFFDGERSSHISLNLPYSL